MTDAWPSALFIAFLVVQRLAELAIARRNTARLLAQGAVEHGAAHYPLIVALHASWLAAIALWGWGEAVRPVWLALFAALQLARLWVLASLGPRWPTRLIVLPQPLVARGPLGGGLVWVAGGFAIHTALVLGARTRPFNAALASLRPLA